ncbi:winged helix-turn-helix transcriptional regulator [Fodinibius halophilus]|uniref:Helix-turn-helix transcriptional regulator n=1 Tax=Fodinibius halophilus TaxID=1736908 RepID=A0A6M1TDT4_9BACT|nr:helix-turn-helix domain-containing protein [Fodinibius halophilus]NGP90181.1 helix-turn-helix transcriptional regulator [Fodinibius halophilus]
MSSLHFDAENCFINKFTSLISGKWKPILLYLIQSDINRFSLMLEHLPNISRKVLTEQLRGLESDGLIQRDELKSKVPKVVIYHLTEKGSTLRQLVDEIISWGMTHIREEVSEEMQKRLDPDFTL